MPHLHVICLYLIVQDHGEVSTVYSIPETDQNTVEAISVPDCHTSTSDTDVIRVIETEEETEEMTELEVTAHHSDMGPGDGRRNV